MGNKHSTSPEEVAAKYGISVEQVEKLISFFHVNNKKGKPINQKKFHPVFANLHHDYPDVKAFRLDMLELIFNILDTDRDKKLSIEEFIPGASILISGSAEERAELIFKAIDRNMRSKISKSEFRAYTSKIIGVAKGDYNREKRDEGMNMALRIGLAAGLKIVEGEIVDNLLKEVWAAGDQDGDNEISREEWMAAATNDGESYEIMRKYFDPGETIKEGYARISSAMDKRGFISSKEKEVEVKSKGMAAIFKAKEAVTSEVARTSATLTSKDTKENTTTAMIVVDNDNKNEGEKEL